MAAVADDEPPPLAVLAEAQRAGRLWVSTAAGDEPVGYVLTGVLDGTGHVEQLSVHPGHGRQGRGRALIAVAGDRARVLGLEALTLTTFRDVPWNAPYYARLGFVVLDPGEWTPGVRAVREHEAALGLDAWPRVVMRLPLPLR
ncbi:GNAT family N-acetyltransferase [Modestobacter sp. I12A-02628]|uniref:GNAT family N-acetyltransferase n=2 Tax=Goekera deserti TaxID=2497753 RepID=A0A7K3WJ06_9ACTN|nr:GNAT family N-acetyltransferase [Goekera deserti]NDI47099.1 GNAT family N-acetyltransferase [Goekera deserti]NEL55503.1 GNAT family N-acetyltransferase [Goekera deserti]